LAGISTTGSRASGHLLRILGVGFGVAVTLGSTIGIGILRSPGLVAGQLHAAGPILVAWLVGGVYTLLGTICLAELGTMVPQAGGYYVYARRAFGDWAGFAVGWTDWITYCCVLGYASIGMSDFLGRLVPSIAGESRKVAIVLLVGFVALQWTGVKISSRFQEWTTALKCLAFLALVVVGLLMSGAASQPAPAAALPALTLSGAVVALQATIITYGGWQSALYFTEEDHDPTRNLPRAMIGGVVGVIALYLLVNIALLAILPMSQFASSTLPASDAAQVIIGERGGQITRILFALGRDRLLWSRAASVNTGGTPQAATLVTTIVAVVLIATGSFERLIALAAFFLALNYAVCCLALVVLRRREPSVARPFRAWGYPWSAAIVVLGALIFLGAALVGDTGSALVATGLLAAGLVGHAIHRAVG
jgi:APA family basic amino acid/polyamine antiporter